MPEECFFQTVSLYLRFRFTVINSHVALVYLGSNELHVDDRANLLKWISYSLLRLYLRLKSQTFANRSIKFFLEAFDKIGIKYSKVNRELL